MILELLDEVLPPETPEHLEIDLTVSWNGEEPQECKVFDFVELGDDDLESLYEFMSEEDLEEVEEGRLIPFAMLGIIGTAEDLSDSASTGLLYLRGERVEFAELYEKAMPVCLLSELEFNLS